MDNKKRSPGRLLKKQFYKQYKFKKMETNEKTENGLVESNSSDLQMQPVSVYDIDLLDTAEASPIDLVAEYWKPQPGEIKRVIFDKIIETKVQSINDPTKIIDLECAFFVTKDNGEAKQIMNGSKRLVGALQAHNLQHGTALEIRYLGKQRNKTNGFESDSWSISPLIIKQSKEKVKQSTDDMPF